MQQGIIYLLTGPAHGARLIVSLWSLRQHYSGPITVYTTQAESHKIGEYCRRDQRLQIDHRETQQVALSKNSSFLTKLELLAKSPYEVGAYLDADTMVSGDIAPLFSAAATSQFAATRFAEWISSGRTIRRRIEAWRTIQQTQYDPEWLRQLIDEALQPYPAVNGGVFGFRRDAEILEAWRQLAYAGWQTFICDEIALQMLLPRFPHEVLDCRFNCSPIYAASRKDVRVWHFHGEKHVRRAACRELWWPAYQACVAENIASLADWGPGADRRLAGFLKNGGLPEC